MGLLFLCSMAAATPTYPSCLTAGFTWDPSFATSLSEDIPSPEACQEICLADSTCTAVTWTGPGSSSADPFQLTCITFSWPAPATSPCAGEEVPAGGQQPPRRVPRHQDGAGVLGAVPGGGPLLQLHLPGGDQRG